MHLDLFPSERSTAGNGVVKCPAQPRSNNPYRGQIGRTRRLHSLCDAPSARNVPRLDTTSTQTKRILARGNGEKDRSPLASASRVRRRRCQHGSTGHSPRHIRQIAVQLTRPQRPKMCVWHMAGESPYEWRVIWAELPTRAFGELGSPSASRAFPVHWT